MSPSDQDTISGAEFTTAAETVKKKWTNIWNHSFWGTGHQTMKNIDPWEKRRKWGEPCSCPSSLSWEIPGHRAEKGIQGKPSKFPEIGRLSWELGSTRQNSVLGSCRGLSSSIHQDTDQHSGGEMFSDRKKNHSKRLKTPRSHREPVTNFVPTS